MSLKALVADDNILNIKLLQDILIDENFEVYTADNGLPVLEMARELLPDVILLDIMMPGLDGFRVCELLKNDPDVKDIPVIMVTAKTDGNDIRQALDIGAFDYIRKPFDEIEAVARIYSAIRYREQQNKLLEFATKDCLTGLFNRAILMELFEKELSRQERCGSDIAFVMMDIDHFKQINDTYGHVAGDTLLREFSGILAGSVRQSDIIGRYGGDEFSLILSRLDLDNILPFCERIRKIIEQSQFLFEGDAILVTTSMGICVKRPDQNITAIEMIQNADAALYRAKNSGRNRTEMY